MPSKVVIENNRDLGKFVQRLGASSREIDKAQVRARRDTLKQVRTRLMRAVAKDVGAPQKNLQSRMLPRSGGIGLKTDKIWIGTHQIAAHKLRKKPQQHDFGVTVGDYIFQHAFIARAARSGHEMVFARRGKSRLKIDKQGVALHPIAARYVNSNQAFAAEKIAERFDHNLDISTGVIVARRGR